jgi:hypothetical protein
MITYSPPALFLPGFLNFKAADRRLLFCVWFGSARIPAFAN